MHLTKSKRETVSNARKVINKTSRGRLFSVKSTMCHQCVRLLILSPLGFSRNNQKLITQELISR